MPLHNVEYKNTLEYYSLLKIKHSNGILFLAGAKFIKLTPACPNSELSPTYKFLVMHSIFMVKNNDNRVL